MEEPDTKFWREYVEAEDIESRLKVQELLPAFQGICKIPEEYQYAFVSLLKSYFDDLINYYEMKK